ncbi:hypothetical protein DV738_g2414, partial [Chaetothyriales sp. CBS 135597]
MAKSKFDAAICTHHLTEKQRAQLPADIWQFFLDSEDGQLDAVYAMKPVNIKAVASDFVSSEIGLTYWPLPEKYQVWQWDMSVEELWSFVADVMIQERKKHKARNPALLSYIPTSNDKDNTASSSSVTTAPGVKRSIKPTAASCRIALGSMDMNITPDGNRGDTVVAVSNHPEGEHVQPDGRRQRLKRAADSIEEDGDQPPTQTRGKKRVATLNRRRLAAPPSPSEDTADLAVMRSAQPEQDDSIVNGVAAPTDQGSLSPVAARLKSGQSGITTLEGFHGIEFESGKLVKLPKVMLAYVRDCEAEAWRAQETASVTKKSQLVTLAKIYRDLAGDLENKILLESVDAEKNGVVEKEYALMDLKLQD